MKKQPYVLLKNNTAPKAIFFAGHKYKHFSNLTFCKMLLKFSEAIFLLVLILSCAIQLDGVFQFSQFLSFRQSGYYGIREAPCIIAECSREGKMPCIFGHMPHYQEPFLMTSFNGTHAIFCFTNLAEPTFINFTSFDRMWYYNTG